PARAATYGMAGDPEYGLSEATGRDPFIKRKLTPEELSRLETIFRTAFPERAKEVTRRTPGPNPGRPVEVYRRVLRIEAVKGRGRYAGQRFYHPFKVPARVYGLSNGDLLVTTRRLKWRDSGETSRVNRSSSIPVGSWRSSTARVTSGA